MASGFESMRVLLADDNSHMRAIVAAILKSIDIHHIREARDGAEALSILREWPVDVAIIDFRMEPVDGVAFTQLVRQSADSVNPFLPIIMLTGYADRERVMEARDAGVTELVVKPVTAKAVIARLQSVIFHPRPFVRTESYFGPCRRRKDSVGYTGEERRQGKRQGAAAVSQS